jgi:PhnB protein
MGSNGGHDMSDFQPVGWHTVTPRLITDDVVGMVEFLRSVFHADGQLRRHGPSEMTIGDSIIMVSDGGGMRQPSHAFLYVYVPNTDETYQRAVASGAQSIETPADMPYGDRRAMVEDPWGNLWQIATHKGLAKGEP